MPFYYLQYKEISTKAYAALLYISGTIERIITMESNHSTTSSIAVKITVIAFVITAMAIGAYAGIAIYLTNNLTSNVGLKLFMTGAGMLFLLAIFMYFGIKYAVQPLNRIADVIEHVSNLDLSADYEDDIYDLVDRNDEIGHIAACTVDMKNNLTNIAGDIQKLVG